MPAPDERGFGATPAESLAHSQRVLSEIERMGLDLERTRRRARENERRFAVKAASALEAGFTYLEIASGLEGMTPFKLKSAIEKWDAEPDAFLVRRYRAMREREPGLGLSEAAEALRIGKHAVMARARAGKLPTVPGARGRRYLLAETTNGSEKS